jgi:hypothetical protein
MYIIKIILTLIGIFLSRKSYKYYRFHRTPLSFSLIIFGLFLIFVSWFDELMFISGLDNNYIIQWINLNFVLIAVCLILVFLYSWIKQKSYLRNIESQITRIIRDKAKQNAKKQ